MTPSDFDLVAFVRESNRIEWIDREPIPEEITAHELVLAARTLNVQDIIRFVKLVAPGAPIRDRSDLNVRVGDHVAPKGGPEIVERLEALLTRANNNGHPFGVHCDYETLHPFIDGNGRSGRAIWLWMMRQQHRQVYRSSFLQTWYYQTLQKKRGQP